MNVKINWVEEEIKRKIYKKKKRSQNLNEPTT